MKRMITIVAAAVVTAALLAAQAEAPATSRRAR
jgi:hypothetical protein